MATIDNILGIDTSNKDVDGAGSSPAPATSPSNETVGSPQPAEAEKSNLSYADLYKQLNPYTPPSDDDLAKIKKKQKRDQIFAAIGDGIGAISNLYFTSKGSPNMYSGRNTASQRTQLRYDRLQKERQDNASNYYSGLIKALGADDKERAWKRTLSLDAQEKERYKDDIEHRDAREKVADNRYNEEKDYQKTRDTLGDYLKKKEFDQREKQYGRQNAIAWARQKDYKDIRELQLKTAGAKTVRGKQLGFSDGQGNQVSVYENVWKGSMQQVYDSMISDGIGKGELSDSRYKMKVNKMSAKDKDDFVKQNWHKSPKASQLMLSLSKLDPATMNSEVGGGGLGWGSSDNNSDNNETDW